MAARTVGIIRRQSLSEVADGWTDCFITYRPATMGELKELSDLKADNMSDDQGIAFMLDFIKKHVVGGQIMLVNEAGELEPAPLEKEDIDSLPQDFLLKFMRDVSGTKLDPKDIQKAAASALPQPKDGNSTETPSSTE